MLFVFYVLRQCCVCVGKKHANVYHALYINQMCQSASVFLLGVLNVLL